MNDTIEKDQDPPGQAPPTVGATVPEAKVGEDAETVWDPNELVRLIAEAEALALYVSRHGNSLSDGYDTLRDGLLKAIANAKSIPSSHHWRDLMSAYAKVTAVTYMERGVNGLTILDTQRKKSRKFLEVRDRPMVIGLMLFVFALIIEVLIQWRSGVSDPSTLTGINAFAYLLIGTLSTFLVPAFWGGIGSCIFLMKRISDKLFDMAYEEARVRGDGTRIFLGAMLGVVTVVLLFPNFSDRIILGKVNLAPATAAFVAGLSVKPIYAGFESLSEELARRFRGSSDATPK